MDFTDYGALNTLKWVLAQSPAGPPSSLWIQMHTGDPGKDATANVADETRRIQFIAAAAANTGTTGIAEASNGSAARWVTLAASEDFSHLSIWDAETGGNPWYKGDLAAIETVLANNDFEFAVGDGVIRHS